MSTVGNIQTGASPLNPSGLTLATTSSAPAIIITQSEYASATSAYQAFYTQFSEVITNLQTKWTGKNTDQDGNVTYALNRQGFEAELQQFINSYFPSSGVVAPVSVLYPPQTAGATTASGKDWASVQQFAIQMGYIDAADQTSVPHLPLPPGVAVLTDGTYVVTVDRRPLDKIMAESRALVPTTASTVTFSTDEYADWQKMLTNQIGKRYGGEDIKGSIWEAIHILLGHTYPNSTTVADILAKTYVRLDQLKNNYLDPYLNILKKHNDFDSDFTADIVNKMSGWTKAGTIATDQNDDENLTPCTVFNLQGYRDALQAFIRSFYGSDNINASSLTTKCILYPPQNSTQIQGVDWNTIKTWAVNSGYLAKGDADQLQASQFANYPFFKQLPDNSFVLIENPSELTNLRDNLPNNDDTGYEGGSALPGPGWIKLMPASQQTFSTTFNDNKSQISERGTLHAQDAQRVHNDYNNQANINSSIDKSLMDTAATVVNNFK